MDLSIVVHIKSSFDEWKALFDADSEERNKFVDESRTICGKVNDNMAMIHVYDVNMEVMAVRMQSPEFAELTEKHVDHHVICTLTPMPRPA